VLHFLGDDGQAVGQDFTMNVAGFVYHVLLDSLFRTKNYRDCDVKLREERPKMGRSIIVTHRS
jgi:hypothetical protein